MLTNNITLVCSYCSNLNLGQAGHKAWFYFCISLPSLKLKLLYDFSCGRRSALEKEDLLLIPSKPEVQNRWEQLRSCSTAGQKVQPDRRIPFLTLPFYTVRDNVVVSAMPCALCKGFHEAHSTMKSAKSHQSILNSSFQKKPSASPDW